MFSAVQVVFLFDVNCLNNFKLTKSSLNAAVNAVKLSCLRLLTEFGAQTENESEVRWATKFYDSSIFKPGKVKSSFIEFSQHGFDLFDEEITQKLKTSYSNKANCSNTRSPPQRKSRRGHGNDFSHCYILNKALQEILKDFNWDLPDVSSPVNTRKTRNYKSATIDDKLGVTFHAIIVFTCVPLDSESLKTFFGNESTVIGASEDLIHKFLEKATVQVLEECKHFRLHLIDTAIGKLSSSGNLSFISTFDDYLSKFNGALHCISSLVNYGKNVLKNYNNENFKGISVIASRLQGLENNWLSKVSRSKGRPRRPQPGPELVWEDSSGSCFLNIKLEILVMHGRACSAWNQASVVGTAHLDASTLTTFAMPQTMIILCREHVQPTQDSTTFDRLLHMLQQKCLILVVKLTCGGIGLLTPFIGSVGCLVVLSLSGLSVPPLNKRKQDSCSTVTTAPLRNFAEGAIKKALSCGGGVAEDASYSDASNGANNYNTDPATSQFSRLMLESWFPTIEITEIPEAPAVTSLRYKMSNNRQMLMSRVQRRYCPHIPALLTSADVTVGNTSSAAVNSAIRRLDSVPCSSNVSKTGTGNGAVLVKGGGDSCSVAAAGKVATAASRALQLVNKSKIVTALQKVKELRDKEDQQEEARSRRVQQSQQRSQKSQALITCALSNIPDTKDSATIIQSLCELRDSVNGKSAVVDAVCSSDGFDLFGTAQTIINLALMHVRSASAAAGAPSAATDAGVGLRAILSQVLHSWRAISTMPRHCQLAQYQLHTLLHLEIMWLMGYSSPPSESGSPVSPEREQRCHERGEHLEEILRLLRAITLHFAPHTTTAFLNNTVLANYEDTLSDVLTEVYEELNQPLPTTLAGPASVATTVLPSPALLQDGGASVTSGGSLMGSCGGGGSRGGMKRINSNLAVIAGGGGRQVVVPGSRMARLTRARSEQAAANSKKSSVRRSLFDGGSLKRSHTITATPFFSGTKRKRPSRGDNEEGASPTMEDSIGGAKRSRLQHTPRDERKRRSSMRVRDASAAAAGLFTPNKYALTPPSLRGRMRLMPANKSGHVLAPATPAHLAGRSRSLRRIVDTAAANTSVAESPDVKGSSRLTPHSLQASLVLNRRSSFYSGTGSRNCQRAHTSLLVQRLQGNCQDIVPDNFLSSAGGDAGQQSTGGVGTVEKTLLFSKLFASAPAANVTRVDNTSQRRKGMRRVLNFDAVESGGSENNRRHSLAALNASPVSRRVTRSVREEVLTPVKKASKILKMETPTKHCKINKNDAVGSEPLLRTSPYRARNSADTKPMTPKRAADVTRLVSLCSATPCLTPSKKVQFSLEFTPSKRTDQGAQPVTPKSILKTPSRTPQNYHTSIACFGLSEGKLTPTRRLPLQDLTPRGKRRMTNTDLSCSLKKGEFNCSQAKTPIKSPRISMELMNSPVKHKVGRLVSPVQENSNKRHSDSDVLPLLGSSNNESLFSSTSISPKLFVSDDVSPKGSKTPNTQSDSPILRKVSRTAVQTEMRSCRVLMYAGNKLLLSPLKSSMKPVSSRKLNQKMASIETENITLSAPATHSNSPPSQDSFKMSFDSAVFVDNSCFTNETELELVSPMKRTDISKASLLVYKNVSSDLSSHRIYSVAARDNSENIPHALSGNRGPSESPGVRDLAEFIERLDHLAEEGIPENEIPVVTENDIHFINFLVGDQTYDDVSQDNVNALLNPNSSFASVQESVLEVGTCLGNVRADGIPYPLLDYEAMGVGDVPSIKLHPSWEEDVNSDIQDLDVTSSSSSPEIEIPSDIRMKQTLTQNKRSHSGSQIVHEDVASDSNAYTSSNIEGKRSSTCSFVTQLLTGFAGSEVLVDGKAAALLAEIAKHPIESDHKLSELSLSDNKENEYCKLDRLTNQENNLNIHILDIDDASEDVVQTHHDGKYEPLLENRDVEIRGQSMPEKCQDVLDDSRDCVPDQCDMSDEQCQDDTSESCEYTLAEQYDLFHKQCKETVTEQHKDSCNEQREDPHNVQREDALFKQCQDRCTEQGEDALDEQCEDTLDEQCEDTLDEQCEDTLDEQCEDTLDEQCEDTLDEQCEDTLDEQCEDTLDEQCEDTLDEQCEDTLDEQCEDTLDEQCEDTLDEQCEDTLDEQCEDTLDEQCEDTLEQCEDTLDEQCEDALDEQCEDTLDERCEDTLDEQCEDTLDEQCEETLDEQCEETLDKKHEIKHDKQEKVMNGRLGECKFGFDVCDSIDDDSEGVPDESCHNTLDESEDAPDESCHNTLDKSKNVPDESCHNTLDESKNVPDESCHNTLDESEDAPDESCHNTLDESEDALDESCNNSLDESKDAPDESCHNTLDKSKNVPDESCHNTLGKCKDVRDESCHNTLDKSNNVPDESCHNTLGKCIDVPDESCHNTLDKSKNVPDESCHNTLDKSKNVPDESCHNTLESKDALDESCHNTLQSKNVPDESCHNTLDKSKDVPDESCHNTLVESKDAPDEQCHKIVDTKGVPGESCHNVLDDSGEYDDEPHHYTLVESEGEHNNSFHSTLDDSEGVADESFHNSRESNGEHGEPSQNTPSNIHDVAIATGKMKEHRHRSKCKGSALQNQCLDGVQDYDNSKKVKAINNVNTSETHLLHQTCFNKSRRIKGNKRLRQLEPHIAEHKDATCQSQKGYKRSLLKNTQTKSAEGVACDASVSHAGGNTRKGRASLRTRSSRGHTVQQKTLAYKKESSREASNTRKSLSGQFSRTSDSTNVVADDSAVTRQSKRSGRMLSSVNYCEYRSSSSEDDEIFPQTFRLTRVTKTLKQENVDNFDDEQQHANSQPGILAPQTNLKTTRSNRLYKDQQSNKENAVSNEAMSLSLVRSQRTTRCNKRLIDDWDEVNDDGLLSDKQWENMSKCLQKPLKSIVPRACETYSHCNRSTPLGDRLHSLHSSLCDTSLGVTPIESVRNGTIDNIPRRQTRSRVATSYVELPSDDSEFNVERSLNSTAGSSAVITDCGKRAVSSKPVKQQVNIDQYLSPVHRTSGDEGPLSPTRFVDVKPNVDGKIDWKLVKSIRNRQKLKEETDLINAKGLSTKAETPASPKLKTRKRRVRLRFLKSGDQYEVSRASLSGDSFNTTGSDLQAPANEPNLSGTLHNSDKVSSKKKLKKKSIKGDTYLTPLRFTRHMSKDLSITPELFQKLMTYSPNPKTHKKTITEENVVNDTEFAKRSSSGNSSSCFNTPKQNKIFGKKRSSEADMWRVQSVPGSPTLKTFIRMQRDKHNILSSPSVLVSPSSRLTCPSVSSMLHLATSPIVKKHKSDYSRVQALNDTACATAESREGDSTHASTRQPATETRRRRVSRGRPLCTADSDYSTGQRSLRRVSKRRQSSSDFEELPRRKRLRSKSPLLHLRERSNSRILKL